MAETPQDPAALHQFRKRVETALETQGDTSWTRAARRVLAEHGQRDGKCIRCVAHPASTAQWIGVGVGASYPCETVLAVASGAGIEERW